MRRGNRLWRRVRDFAGRRYVYFRHYERSNGRSVRREVYIGRVGSERAKAEQEFARKRARIERLVTDTVHTST